MEGAAVAGRVGSTNYRNALVLARCAAVSISTTDLDFVRFGIAHRVGTNRAAELLEVAE